jgi:hypothetical protein
MKHVICRCVEKVNAAAVGEFIGVKNVDRFGRER